MKKMLALLLTLCLLAGMVPLSAGAEGTEDGTGPWMVDFGAGAQYYSTFENALEAVKVQEKNPGPVYTIYLTQDTTESITIGKDETAVVNIEGKVTLTNEEGKHTITVNQGGSLLVEGRGKVDNVSHGKGAVYNSGYVELRGDVTFDRSKENGSNDSINGGNSWYTICNHGEMEISENATVTTAGGGENLSTMGRYSSLVENGYYDWDSGNESSGYVSETNDEYPSLTIKGGNFSGGLNTIKNDDHGIVDIKNGNFGNYYQCVVMNHHKATVTGGTFTAAEGSDKTTYGFYNCACASDHDIGELEISGGTFSGADFAVADVSSVGGKITISNGWFSGTQGAIGVTANHTGDISISGGTFSSDVSAYLADGYVQQENGVVALLDESNAAAKIGEKYYKTLADAVAAVHKETGEDRMKEHVITLLKSVSGGGFGVGYESLKDSGGKITAIGNSPVNIVIDLGQNKYTIEAPTVGSSGTETNGFQFLKGSSVTIRNGSMELKSGVRCAYLFQNYANLTLDDVSVDISGNEPCEALLQTMHGKVDIIGNTSLISGDTYVWNKDDKGTQRAIKVMDWNTSDYGAGTQVTIDTTGTIDGSVRASYYKVENASAGPEKSTLTIKNGHFTKDIDRLPDENSPEISIFGGYFTSDPSDYVATGYYAGESDNPAYAYQVKQGKKDTPPAEVVAAEPDVKAAADIDTTVTTALSGTTADLTAAANEQAANNKVTGEEGKAKLIEAGIIDGDDTDPDVTVVVQPYLAMEAKSYDGTNGTMTVDIKAMYRTVATTAKLDGADAEDIIVSGEAEVGETANAVVIGEKENTLPVKGSVEISIPLPNGFVTSTADDVFVQHKNTYEYEATVTKTGTDSNETYTATFTNPHGFSTFVLSTGSKSVAAVNGTNYTNFQQAVDDAGANGTVEVKADGQIAKGVTHKLTLTNGAGKEITVTINGTEYAIKNGETLNFTYTPPTPPRPTEEKHSITISTDGKGQVTGPASAAEDDKVTLTVKPNADKELYDLKVTDEDGKAIAVTKVNDTTYTFTMPDGKVTIAATFGCDGGDNCPSKAFTDLGDKQWYHDFIDYAVENGLLEGTSPTTMEPNATLIRAQLAQILYNIEDKPAVTGEMIFEDVPASEWFYSPVLWANQNEIINGTSPITFEPLEDISRQDLALMLYRYAGEPAVTGDLDGFTDADQVGDWAEEAMAWAVAEGIVQGDTPTTLNPTGTATRAEAAAMLQRFQEDAA